MFSVSVVWARSWRAEFTIAGTACSMISAPLLILTSCVPE